MTCDCSVPASGNLGQLWRCAVCGTWWIAFDRYDDEGLTVWWEPIVTGEAPGSLAGGRTGGL